MWRLWAKALGEKSGSNDTEANQIALIRTALVLFTICTGLFSFITNIFIIAGIIRHW